MGKRLIRWWCNRYRPDRVWDIRTIDTHYFRFWDKIVNTQGEEYRYLGNNQMYQTKYFIK